MDRSAKWREACRVYIEGFRDEETAILGRPKEGTPAVPDFRGFRGKYFSERGITHPHMEPWMPMVGDPSVRRVIVVGPPEHGRTTVLNVQQLAWLACKESHEVYATGRDPEWPLRAAVISAKGDLAERMGWQLQRYLTDPMFSGDMIRDYGPFRSMDRDGRWSATEMYFAWRSAAEKDPSCQFLGWGSGIQSARLTHAIMDDCDDPLSGKSDRTKLLRFTDQIVIPRLGNQGQLWYLCNRVDELDVARELLERAEDGTWYAIVQAALEDGKPIWYDRYTVDHFDDVRKQLRNDRLFSLVYMSKPLTGESQDFPLALIQQARDPERRIGHYPRESTMICTLDPATRGGAGVMAYAINPRNGRRYVVDADWGTDRRTLGLRRWIEDYTLRYRPRAFGIETQGGYDMLEDPAIIKFLADYDCRMVPLKTGTNKYAADYGVTSMAALFDYDRTLCKISIPWADDESRRKMQPLIEQLASYHPESDMAHDLVICLWLAERVIDDLKIVDSAQRKSIRILDPIAHKRPYVLGRQRAAAFAARSSAWQPFSRN